VSPDWWAALGPAQTQVSCGGSTHRLRWSGGSLQAVDHPDAEGELVMAALGGDTNPCLDLVMAWGRHSDDLTVLAIGPRSASDALTVTPRTVEDLTSRPPGPFGSPRSMGASRIIARRHATGLPRGRGGGLIRSSAPVPTPMRRPRGSPWNPRGIRLSGRDDPARVELLRLLALGQPFQLRLSGAVAHAWSAGGRHARRGNSGPALTAALAGRLEPAAAQWLGIDAGDVDAAIHDDDGWGQLSLAPQDSRKLVARLPVSWLAGVWAPGLAVVGGHLVVSVLAAAWPEVRVLAVRSPGRDPAELTIRQRRGHWSVAAR